jgi:hypothetical protein
MNSIFLSIINNSRAAYEPFIDAFGYGTPFSAFSHYLDEIQRSSVSPSGFLWLQTLAHIAYENPIMVSQSEIKRNELNQSIAQSQKNRDLIQLLRSWREGDENECRPSLPLG